MTHSLVADRRVLADEAPRDTGPDFGKASPFGLVVVVVLLVGTFLLVWSMNRHLKHLPESFDPITPSPTRPSTTARSTCMAPTREPEA